MRFGFLGGPGSGKSQTAAWLFSELKRRRVSVELVTEFVKRWSYQKRKINEFDQCYIFGKQMMAEYEFLSCGVKNVVTDSPVILSAVYSQYYHKHLNISAPLKQIIAQYDKSYPVELIFLDRGDKPYEQKGRYQTKEQAIELDRVIRKELKNHRYVSFDFSDRDAILNYVLERVD